MSCWVRVMGFLLFAQCTDYLGEVSLKLPLWQPGVKTHYSSVHQPIRLGSAHGRGGPHHPPRAPRPAAPAGALPAVEHDGLRGDHLAAVRGPERTGRRTGARPAHGG